MRNLPIIESAIPREKAIIRPSQLAPLLAGEVSCMFQSWLMSNYEDYPEISETKDWSLWNERHLQLLEKTRSDLESRGCVVYTEGQNTFNLEGAAGFVKGKCDLVAHDPKTGIWTILDPKSGKPKASHITQVKLYMWLLGYTEKYKGIVFNGAVVYQNNVIPIPQKSLTPRFIEEAKMKIAEIGSDIPGRQISDKWVCKFCKIPSIICPARYDEKSGAVKVDLF